MSALLLDVGNTRLKWGELDGGAIRRTGHISRDKIRELRILRSNALDPRLILTGGDASRILKSLDETPLHRPHLVLQGLAHMLESR